MSHLGPTLRRRRRPDRPGLRAAVAVSISLLANWLLVTRIDPASLGLGPVKQVNPVGLAALSAADWNANRTIRDPRAPPAPNVPPRPPEPPPDEQRKAPGQVVETAASQARTPKETRYVSDRDNAVEKETRSRFHGPGAPAAPPGPIQPGAAASAASGGQQGKSEKFVEGRLGERAGQDRRQARNLAEPKGERTSTAGGELPTLPWDRKQGPEPAGASGPGGEDGQRRPGQFDPRLALSPKTLARLAGGGSPDKLDDVEEGDGTFLNTREWKYATYFNRIKQAVSMNWRPLDALEKRDPDRTLFGNRDRVTLLDVTLDDTGQLKNVVIKRTSGVDFLDKTTIEAFQKAQPFVNPPPGIIEPNGEIRFTYGFYLWGTRAGFQIYRGAQ